MPWSVGFPQARNSRKIAWRRPRANRWPGENLTASLTWGRATRRRQLGAGASLRPRAEASWALRAPQRGPPRRPESVSARGGEGRFDGLKPAGVHIQPHKGAGGGTREERSVLLVENRRTGVGRIGPLGDPLEPERSIEAVEIGQAGEQAERVFAHVTPEGGLAKLGHARGQGGATAGLRPFTGQAAKHAVNHGEGGEVGFHELGGKRTAPPRRGDNNFVPGLAGGAGRGVGCPPPP